MTGRWNVRVALFVAVGVQALVFAAYYRITDGCYCSVRPRGQTFSRADLFMADLLNHQAEMFPFGGKYLPEWMLNGFPFLAWDGLPFIFGAGLATWFLGLLAVLDSLAWMTRSLAGTHRRSPVQQPELTPAHLPVWGSQGW